MKNDTQGTNPAIIQTLPDGRMTPLNTSKYIGVSIKTLASWRSAGGCSLKFSRLGGRIFYFKKHVDEWISQHSGKTSAAQARISNNNKHI